MPSRSETPVNVRVEALTLLASGNARIDLNPADAELRDLQLIVPLEDAEPLQLGATYTITLQRVLETEPFLTTHDADLSDAALDVIAAVQHWADWHRRAYPGSPVLTAAEADLFDALRRLDTPPAHIDCE